MKKEEEPERERERKKEKEKIFFLMREERENIF